MLKILIKKFLKFTLNFFILLRVYDAILLEIFLNV